MSLIQPNEGLNELLNIDRELNDHQGHESIESNNSQGYGFIELLNDHINNRKEICQPQGTGKPCLAFAEYYITDNNETRCAVSLSGHNTYDQEEGDTTGLIGKLFRILKSLIGIYNDEHRHNKDTPLYEFIDYDSKNYNEIIDHLNEAKDDVSNKPCTEKKLFCYLFKKAWEEGIEVKSSIACRFKFEGKKRKLKTKNVVFSDDEVYIELIPPCQSFGRNKQATIDLLKTALTNHSTKPPPGNNQSLNSPERTSNEHSDVFLVQ